MFQMLTQNQIDKFYIDVKRLALKFPVAAISKATGFGKGQVSIYLSKNDEPSENFINKFYEKFGGSLKNVPHGNTGETFDKQEEPLNLTTQRPNGNNFITQRREQKNVFREFMVPLIPVKAQAGYAMSYPDTQHFSESLEKYPMLPGISYQGAEWRYFEVEGDSMIPTLFDKDYILVSAVLREDWQDVKPNKPYVVVLHEDVFVKFIYQVDRETWILASANRKVKHKKISVEDVKELWVFRGRTTKNLDIPKIEIKV